MKKHTRRNWSVEEERVLRNFYCRKDKTIANITKTLKRCNSSVRLRARRMGLKRPNSRRPWNKQELNLLKHRYPWEGASKSLASELGRTRDTIRTRAGLLGLRMTKEAFRKLHADYRRIGEGSKSFKGYRRISGVFLSNTRINAKRRNLECPILDGSNISNKYLWDLYLKQDKKCFLSGKPIKFKLHKTAKCGTASLDRIDSSKGYIRGNVQWLHKDVNWMKQDYSQRYFIAVCKLISRYRARRRMGHRPIQKNARTTLRRY